MRYVPMKALRETYHAIHILRTVGLSKLPEEHVPSTKEPSLPRLHPLTPRFLSSHIPEFREIVHHPNLKKASALIPQLQEDDREGSHVTVFSPGLAMLQLSRYKSNYREANKKRKDGGSDQPCALSVLCGCLPSPLHCQVRSLCGDCWTHLSRALRPCRGHCLGERNYMHLRPHSRAKKKLFLVWISKG